LGLVLEHFIILGFFVVFKICDHGSSFTWTSIFHLDVTFYDAPLSSLMDSAASLKKKTMEGEGVGARSLARNISKVEGHVGASGWD
jgi:hypothetical protein